MNKSMTGKDVFKIWAPAGARWADWVGPVPFVAMGDLAADVPAAYSAFNFNVPDVLYFQNRPQKKRCNRERLCAYHRKRRHGCRSDRALSDGFTLSARGDDMHTVLTGNRPRQDTAVIVDLPGYESICEGLALARLGLRPVPLFNGTNPPPGAMALVDNHPTQAALAWGAPILADIALPGDAPPAFLLDLNRMLRYKMSVSVFDNSWDLYDQDIPSAGYFLKHGISRIIVRSVEKLQKDLRKILHKFQRKGIRVLFTNGFCEAKEVSVRKGKTQ